MTTSVQRRRGSTTQHSTFTGLEGEITIDTTKDTAVIHDGSTVGGFPLSKENFSNGNPVTLNAIAGAATADDDLFLIYDSSTNEMKKITRAELNNAIEADALASVTITGGSINGTTIGASTASTGAFTTLGASGTATLNTLVSSGATITGGSINNVPIGASTSSTGAFTTLAYTGTLTGGTGVINIGSGQFYKDAGGNVGIGESAPSYAKFIVKTTGGAGISVAQGTENFYGASIHKFFNEGYTTERMRIDSSGNVMVGTSTPRATFTVIAPDATGNGINITNTSTANNTTKYASLDYAGTDTASSWKPTGYVRMSPADANYVGSNMIFATRGSDVVAERMRIDSSGYVGIGTTTPQNLLDVGCGSTSAPTYKGTVRVAGGALATNGGLEFLNTTYASGFGWRMQAPDEGGGSTPLVFQYRNNSNAWTELARFASDASFLVGCTSFPSTAATSGNGIGVSTQQIAINNSANVEGIPFNYTGWTSGTIYPIVFRTKGTVRGFISWDGTTLNYTSTSDYRLKDDISPMVGALDVIAKLKPCNYTWKDSGIKSHGFIAHEVKEVIPEAATGEKDAVDENGNIVPQGIDPSKMVATLVAAIQEQQALIEKLTTRLNALEGK